MIDLFDISNVSPPPQLSTELLSVLEVIEDGVCIKSITSYILYANNTFLTMLGKNYQDVIGRQCTEIFGCLNPNNPIFDLCKQFSTCNNADDRDNGLHSTKQPLTARISPLRNAQGEIIYYLMIVRNIGDVIHRERELARAEQHMLLGELAAGLAHEIKNPLAGIQGAMDILINRSDPYDPSSKVLNDVRHEVSRIDAAINALREHAQPRSLKLAPASLAEVVDRAVRFAQEELINSSITISFQALAKPLTFEFDAIQIEDVVLKLILNSIEASDNRGHIEVKIYLSKAPTQINDDDEEERDLFHSHRDMAVIEVIDQGRGIPDKDLPNIFSTFFTTKQNGTGLGLAAVNRIIRAHRGQINVSSQVGQGTKFILMIPIITD